MVKIVTGGKLENSFLRYCYILEQFYVRGCIAEMVLKGLAPCLSPDLLHTLASMVGQGLMQ
jgi:hypothetical protein